MRVDPELVRSLHREVGDRLQREQVARRHRGDRHLAGLAEQQYARKLTADTIREHAELLLGRGMAPLDLEAEQVLAEGVHARMYGAGQLQVLLDDDAIENIDINGCDEVWVTRAGGGGRARAEPVASTDEELVELVQTLASYAGLSSRPWDTANPELDLQLPDGSRLSAVQGLSARPVVSIRRHRRPKATMGDLVGNGTLTQDAAQFLTAAVKARFNIMIAGATNAGKTTLLRALASEIGSEERIVTVERALELGLRRDTARHPDCVEFEERVANSEGLGAVSMAALVRRTLRMNPDRVIVGEVLGDEVITMLNAMGQGNDGSLSTIHTRSAREVFNRIATYAIQGRERLPHEASYQLIAGGLDFVVYVSRELGTGRRRLVTVLEVNGFDNGVQASEIFRTGTGGAAEWTGVMPARIDRLAAAGWAPSAGEW
jgi:Flp pilus assembly CpaF family ATPase